MEFVILLAQTACLGFLTLWLTTGVRDNILHPDVNEETTAEVMDMARMRSDFPEAYAQVAHRRIASRRLQRAAFLAVVVWEVAATLALWGAVVAMGLALWGALPTETARAVGIAATLMFTTTWALFLIVGNHFCYWFGHDVAQNTHFQMTFWGLGTMILLAIPG